MKIKLTKEQKAALHEYNFAVAQEDRYLGSVFVNEHGARKHAEKVKVAYERCIALGMDYQHGL